MRTPLYWQSSYPDGIPRQISNLPWGNLSEFVDEYLKKHRMLPAYTCMGKTLTFEETDRLSGQFAAYLVTKCGMKPGDRIALMMPNILQYPIALFGALRAGLIVVNINPQFTPRELELQLKDSSAKAIVILENYGQTLEKILARVDVKKVITTGLGDLLDFPKGPAVNFFLRRIVKKVPVFKIPGSVSFVHALQGGLHKRYRKSNATPHDIAFLQYTGGTTGIAKGAMLSHSNLMANIVQAGAWIEQDVQEGHEVVVTALPLYHIFSLTANCLTFLKFGGHNLLIPNPRDLDSLVKALAQMPFSVITGVNTLFAALSDHPEFRKLDFQTLKFALGGGAAIEQQVADNWHRVTLVPITQAYGLTETSPAVTMNPLSLKEFNGTIGVPLPSTEIKIVNDSGQEVESGTAGEVWVRGPQVMQGYWRRPDESEQVLTPDGWLKTGDIGLMDDRGYVKIVDRKKDLILVSGFNVYPNEIENVVVKHHGVAEAAAVGVPDRRTGEAVKVFAVRKDPGLTADDVIKHCRGLVTSYKVPKTVEFIPVLPRSSIGKILRRSLRDPV